FHSIPTKRKITCILRNLQVVKTQINYRTINISENGIYWLFSIVPCPFLLYLYCIFKHDMCRSNVKIPRLRRTILGAELINNKKVFLSLF
ncbi:hypothetical protein GIB67_001715, partial [Kingdonia uniflora]